MLEKIRRFGFGGLAIAATVVTPLSVLANPLEGMEGWVYTTRSEPGTAVQTIGLPEGIMSQGGALLGDVAAAKPFLFSVYVYRGEMIASFEQLLLQRPVGDANEQYREILDTDSVAPGQWLTSCEVNQIPDPEIVAIAMPDAAMDIDTEWVTTFQGLWRANRTTRQLEPVPADNVRCYNIGYGYDG
jgi:hypothetical protein